MKTSEEKPAPTPITVGHVGWSPDYKSTTEHARNLERQLAEVRQSAVCIHEGIAASAHGWALKYSEMREQRDMLAVALREIASGKFNWKQCVDIIAPEALAAVKGVSNDTH